MTTVLLALLIYMNIKSINLLYAIVPHTLVFVLPVLYIHYNYYTVNKGVQFILDNSGIYKNTNGNEVFYNASEFDQIEFVMTGKRISNMTLGNLPFEDYYYAKIHLNQFSDVIIITCLYPDKVENLLKAAYEKIPIKYSKQFFPKIL